MIRCTLGALVSAIVAGASGMFGGDDLPPPPPARAEPGEATVSAYFGRMGGSRRFRRASVKCRNVHDVLEKTRRDVAYDKRRSHRLPPTRTSTGLRAR